MVGKITGENLGRFGHHPDPAVDFCVEVDIIEGLVADVAAKTAEYEPVADRVFKAMQFTVGGTIMAVAAKQALREAEADLKKLEPAPQTVRRWALWCKQFGYLAPLPLQTELLYDTKAAAVSGRLSGSHYDYQPVRVKIVPELPGGDE